MTQSKFNLPKKMSELDILLDYRNGVTGDLLSWFSNENQLVNSQLSFVTLTFSPEKIEKKSLYYENFVRSFIKMLQLLDCAYVFTRQEGHQKSTEEMGFWHSFLAYVGDNPPQRDFSNTHFHGIVETSRSLDLFLRTWETSLGNYDHKPIIKNLPKACYYLLHEDGIMDDLRIFASKTTSYYKRLSGILHRNRTILEKISNDKRKYGRLPAGDLSIFARKNRGEFV